MSDSDRHVSPALPDYIPVTQVDPKHLNKPLTSDTERRYLRGAENDLRVLVENQVKAVELLTKAAEDMEEAYEGEADSPARDAIAKIDQEVRQILDLIAVAGFERAEFTALRQRVTNQEDVANVKTAKDGYNKLSARQKYANNPPYVEFRTRLHAVKAGAGSTPNMAALLPAEEGDDSDDELEMQGQGTISLKCPLLFTDFVKPMRNYLTDQPLIPRSQKCPHRVDQSAIAEYWTDKTKACPTAGCDVPLRASDWIPDVQLERSLAKDKSRRDARAEVAQSQAFQIADSDDEESMRRPKREVKPQTQHMVDSDEDD